MKFKTSHRQEEAHECNRIYIDLTNGEEMNIEERRGEIVIRCSNEDYEMVIQPTASNQFVIRFIPRAHVDFGLKLPSAVLSVSATIQGERDAN